ncbi:hypothetical protein FHS16_001006 [Paenibacillus endophyticus]|uniref:Uncharacterized protein n=1 Tax=Paenibacillus endophyticus TaxID=1294268 RepID=A0A7W5G9H7_9BACL|nr:hypothetical protein [Paenibacillus endophyticus]
MRSFDQSEWIMPCSFSDNGGDINPLSEWIRSPGR